MYIRVIVAYSLELINISSVIGWCYFVAWSISFYPQIYTNFRRKSVIGLNFDFISLNVVGFVLYAIFNVGLYFIPEIQVPFSFAHMLEWRWIAQALAWSYLQLNCFSSCLQDEYSQRFPRSLNPVQLNDVFFSCHAMFATIITICQCFAYDVSTKTSSIPLIPSPSNVHAIMRCNVLSIVVLCCFREAINVFQLSLDRFWACSQSLASCPLD